MKKTVKLETILSISLCFTPFILGMYLWSDLPDLVISNFGYNGSANSYSSKFFMVVILPSLLILLNLFLLNKMKKEIKSVPPITIWLIPVLVNIIFPLSYFSSINSDFHVEQLIFIFISLLYIIIGNYLPKCRHNYYVGIRIPTTLKSEDNWNYTHRKSGPIFVISGFMGLIFGFLELYTLVGISTISALIISISFSIIYWKKHKI